MDSLKIERSPTVGRSPSQLITKYTPDNPVIAMIDRQTTELESLIRRNKF
ncbi:hypothetical protein NIES2111_33750 [Nostoc sp. NIES-2111]|nr:hypothetical protein NIES2111_33750 [Nostoc sp. NIES-2111]